MVLRGGEALREEGRKIGALGWSRDAPALRSLLDTDIDLQRQTPLQLLRGAARWPTQVLQIAGTLTLDRDGDSSTRFPTDVYDLTPAAFSDFGDAVAEAGLRWSVGKAFEHKRRRAT